MPLPQETYYGPLPWSMLILGMQVVGVFPYRIPNTDQKPKFSMVLCLWSIFIQTWLSVSVMQSTRITYITLITPEVEMMAFLYSSCLLFLFATLSPFIVFVNSKKWVDLLTDFAYDTDPICCHPLKWSRKPLTVAFVLRIPVGASFFISFAYMILGTTMKELLFFFPLSHLFPLTTFLPLDLSEKTFDFLSKELAFASDAVLKTASIFSGRNEEEYAVTFISDLQAFEFKVLKIVQRRRRVMDLSFFHVSFFLFVSTVVAVSSFYAVLRGKMIFGSTLVAFSISAIFIVRLCHMGNRFIRKVEEVTDALRDLRCRIRSQAMRTRISQVLTSVEELQRFSVCGWYDLDYSTLLTIFSTVITYLVILVQIGAPPTPKNI